MIELLLEQAGDPSLEQHFLRGFSAHVAAVKASAHDRPCSWSTLPP